LARRPFDPTRVSMPKETEPLTTTPDDRPLTVTQLTQMVKRVLTSGLPSTLTVTGELGNVSQPSSGHLYFTLKDAGSEVKCVMWRSAAKSLRFRPEDGMEVLATGGVDVYEPRGQYQLYVRKLQPKGLGELELAFRQLREKLEREGLFDPARKKALPPYPERIAVVTSLTGAAIRDIIQPIRRRFPCLAVWVYPVRVQGERAAQEIATAIRTLNQQADRLGGIDVVIVGRGGGSLEDLWAFNEEVVARAIFASRIPIISAVGHEVDVTISDLVADVRAPTPTAAAEMLTPSLDEVLESIDVTAGRLYRVIRHRLDLVKSELANIERFELFRHPLGVIRSAEQQIDESDSRLSLVLTRRLHDIRQKLHKCEVMVGTIHPQVFLEHRYRQLDEMEHRFRWAQGARNIRAERKLRRAVQALMEASPKHLIVRHRSSLDHWSDRLSRTFQNRQLLRQRDLDGLAARLNATGHKTILKRGFSITRHHRSGRIVTDPSQVREGDRLTTETSGGTFDSRVTNAHQLDLFE